MNNGKAVPVSSSELGTLWMTYQQKTMLARMFEHFIQVETNSHITPLLQSYYDQEMQSIQEIVHIFKNDDVVIPGGFVETDVHLEAPPLYGEYFSLLFLRVMMKVSIGLNALHITMSYRQDIINFYQHSLTNAHDLFSQSTMMLQELGVLPRPPHIPVPKKVEYVESKSYMSGINPLGTKRPVNAVEIAHLYHGIETNILGMQLIAGFSQVAENKAVRQYFTKGKELSKRIIKTFSNTLMENDLQPPATSYGNPTTSNIAPFSEKLMIYCISLLSNFGLTSNALGTSFSLRNDLPTTMSLLGKEVFTYAKEGGKLMIDHNWMEQPPEGQGSTNK
ncbi:DUF3231 family protein [Bacillus sp. CGMCC 1.16541]|uniref:DUF3231 family protein n=1 Tax=Bacillus sp. CGMCC 1.16541 TaxID=2185143 RepID=UPI000D729973|nr:DUF3231 family protein [Bacillus sp. CGMCC 1.16541]